MLAGKDNFEAEAIFFLDDGNVSKEILHVEFEAILDNYVGIPEFKNQVQQAAYVSIVDNLRVDKVVLFSINFDDQGHVPHSWNLPLRYMASLAHEGPDLGDGPIKVLSADDPVEPEYHQYLWDSGKRLVEVLTAINCAVKQNKLGTYVDSGQVSFANSLQSPQVIHATHFAGQPIGGAQHYLSNNLESALREQQARLRTELEAGHADSMQKLAIEKAQLVEQSDALSRQMQALESESRRQIEIIVDKYRAKLRSQLAEQESHWQNVLAEKELALHYAQNKEQQMRDELEHMQRSQPTEQAKAIQSFLQQLIDEGVELIVSENRLGSYGLKLHQIHDYLENKDAFWAAQNGISEQQYKAWRKHYEHPVCQAGASTGCLCGAVIRQVDHPRNFILGESDVCHEHRIKKVGEYL